MSSSLIGFHVAASYRIRLPSPPKKIASESLALSGLAFE